MYGIKLIRTALAILALSILNQLVWAQDWPNWRGPNFNGSTEAAGLPTQFDRKQNVKWAVDMPGPSASTPIVYGDCVFASSTDVKAMDLVAFCMDRKTGAVRWKKSVCSGYQAGGAGTRLQLDDNSNYASPSPVTDGKHVVFFYGNGDLACFDFSGNRLWFRNLQKDYGDFAYQWTFSSSPQLYDGRLYMQILQRDKPASGGRGREGAESYLLALNPETGKELWRAVRPTSAIMESREAYSTPIPITANGRKEIVIAGGDILTGHDPATGKELWRWGTWNPDHHEMWWRLVPSPVAGGGVVLACAPKGMPVYAAKAGGSGSLGTAGLAWQSERRNPLTSDVPTPCFYKGKFIVVSDQRKAISCVEPSTGKIDWSTPLPGPSPCWASPSAADGKIYVMSLRGEVFIVNFADGKIIAQIPMAVEEDDMRSTIAIAHNNLFIRTNSKLYCIGR